MRNIKAQAAAELLTVYGWVILFLLIVLVVAYYSGYLDIRKVLPTYCSLAPNMACNTFRFGYVQGGNSMILLYRVVNGVGNHILFANNSITLTAENVGKYGKVQYNGTCAPTSLVINPGALITCYVIVPDMQAIPSIGNNLDLKVSMNYRNCDLDPTYLKTGDCSGAPQYSIGGSIRTPMEPAMALYACGDGVCDYEFGESAGNCCQDCPVSSFTFAANLPAVTCTPSDPTCNGANYKMFSYQEAELVTTAIDSDGLRVSNATVNFTKLGGIDQFEYLIPSSNITNTSGQASSFYSSQVSRDLVINATSCGTSASLKLHVNNAPPNATLVFSSYPNIAPVGGSYKVNVTVYNMSGFTVPSVQVFLVADSDSTASPAFAITDANGVAQFSLSSNVIHVARLIAKAIGMWNATNLFFMPPIGTIVISNNGPVSVGSESYADISACLYTADNQPISGAAVDLTTSFGYFMGGAGTQKLPSLKTFATGTGGRPTSLANARANGIRYEVFGYNSTSDIADPVEFDAYAGKFVKVEMNGSDEKTKAQLIADYLVFKGTGGRTVYIFYNSSYGSSYINPKLLFNNLTQQLNSRGISYTLMSDPNLLRATMLGNAMNSIIISASDALPIEVWACEADGGVPKEFFERGGIQIYTGDYEFYYASYSNGTKKTCAGAGASSIFGWTTAGSYGNIYENPVMMSSSTQAETYVGGCFNITTPHPQLYSSMTGDANVTATYLTAINSTVVNFVYKSCTGGVANGTCSSTQPLYCLNGYLGSRCDICGCSSVYQTCNNESGNCSNNPGYIILAMRSFDNGSGVNLPNDNFTRLQVIAQVFSMSGTLLSGINVSWATNGVLLNAINCNSTTSNCGDYGTTPTPSDPRVSIYVNSNGSWSGVGNVTAIVNFSGVIVTNSTNISVYNIPTIGGADAPVNPHIRTSVYPLALPVDNYTSATIRVTVYDQSDSVVGNSSVCFSTTVGLFANNSAPTYCTNTDRFGRISTTLRSYSPGNAVITATILNSSGALSVYSISTIYFYSVPAKIIINTVPNPTVPCASCSATMFINATFLDSNGNPIPNIPYVYFNQTPDNIVLYSGCTVANTSSPYYSETWCKLIPAYKSGWSNCASLTLTTGTCSASADASGTATSKFTSVYPPGTYSFQVTTFYRCTAGPFYPGNCLSSVSNSSSVNLTPVPATIIIDRPVRKIKPDGIDSVNATFTLYGSNGSAMKGVYYYGMINPNGTSYTIPSPYYTNASGRGIMTGIKSQVAGNYTLTFYTYYYNSPNWVNISNSTNIRFGPIPTTLIVNVSPNMGYADGVFGSNALVTLLDENGNPMNNTLINIPPAQIDTLGYGMLGCCGTYGCGCYNVTTNASGQFATTIYSVYAGDSNITAYTTYMNGTAGIQLANSTILTFESPPAIAKMTATPPMIDNSGVNQTVVTTTFTDAYSNPTPYLPVDCNVSSNGVIFPFASVADSNAQVFTVLSAIETPATVVCWYASSVLVVGSIDVPVSTLMKPRAVAVNVTAQPNQTTAGSYVLILANVTNYTTGAPQVGKEVNFSTSYGGVLNMTKVTTNASGIAVVNVTAMTAESIFVNANVSGDFGVVKVKYT